MFREMRRKGQSLPMEECERILNESTHGVLALLGDDGYPYAVPLNHAYADGKIYFHCAVEGHKLDAIRNSDKASYCIIDASDVDSEIYSTRFRSVIAFGRVRIVENNADKMRVLKAIGDKFCPATPDKTMQEIQGAIGRTGIIELTLEHVSGKESRALAAQRKQA